MITWLASYPRSGNSMYRESLWQLYGIRSYSRHNDPEVRRDGMQDAIGHIDLDLTLEVIDKLERSEEMHFVKTHHLEERRGNTVYIVRDGRDVMVNFAHFKKNIEGAIEPFGEILMKLCQSNSWQRNVLYWLEHGKEKGQFVLVKYENMLHDPSGVLLWSLDQLGLAPDVMPNRAIMPFEELHRQWPKFFASGKEGCWKSEMPQDVCQIFAEHNWKAMQEMGYVL